MPCRCCVVNCEYNANVTLYSFPKDDDLKDKWLSVLPNLVPGISSLTKICAKHWPENAKMKKPFRSRNEVSMLKCFVILSYLDIYRAL